MKNVRQDLLRAWLMAAVASGMGLLLNAAAARPVPLLDAEGPGSLPKPGLRVTVSGLKAEWESGKPLILLDVRRQEALAQGRPARSVHVAADRFEELWVRRGLSGAFRAAEGIVIICEGGRCTTGDHVAKILRTLGYIDVRVLEGGWPAYLAAGLEVLPP